MTAEEILEKADDDVKQEVQNYLNDEEVDDNDDDGGVNPTMVTNIDTSDLHNAKAMEYLRSVISTHLYFAPY